MAATHTHPMFPLFTSRFLSPSITDGREDPTSIAAGRSSDVRTSPPPAAPRIGGLRVLDLRALPRDDGPPTELRTRKEKLAHFEKECTPVGDNLFVGAEVVAKSRQILNDAGITHIVNCVGFLYPQYFEDEVKYQTLYLQDSPHEDILCVLYDVFDFIAASQANADAHGGISPDDGRVLIHCSQGISRSASLAIAYKMWKNKQPYEHVFNDVKSKRGVANPNIGFTCQLMAWHKRLTEDAHKERLYRMAPQSTSAPQYLVPKTVAAVKSSSLDPRGAFVLHTPTALYVWSGSQCPEAFTAAAQRFARQLQRYENAPEPAVFVDQGKESEEFWKVMAGGNGGVEERSVGQVKPYDNDYLIYARSSGSPMNQDNATDSARSGRKTPRSFAGDYATSPNDRLRKQARSEAGTASAGGGGPNLERSNSRSSEGLGNSGCCLDSDRLDSARALRFKGPAGAGDREEGGLSKRSSLPPIDDPTPLAAPRGDKPRRSSALPPLNLQQLKRPDGVVAPSPRVTQLQAEAGNSGGGPPGSARGGTNRGSGTPRGWDGSEASSPGGSVESAGGEGQRNAQQAQQQQQGGSRLAGRRPVPKIALPKK